MKPEDVRTYRYLYTNFDWSKKKDTDPVPEMATLHPELRRALDLTAPPGIRITTAQYNLAVERAVENLFDLEWQTPSEPMGFRIDFDAFTDFTVPGCGCVDCRSNQNRRDAELAEYGKSIQISLDAVNQASPNPDRTLIAMRALVTMKQRFSKDEFLAAWRKLGGWENFQNWEKREATARVLAVDYGAKVSAVASPRCGFCSAGPGDQHDIGCPLMGPVSPSPMPPMRPPMPAKISQTAGPAPQPQTKPTPGLSYDSYPMAKTPTPLPPLTPEQRKMGMTASGQRHLVESPWDSDYDG